MTNELENLKILLPVTKFQPPATQDTIERAKLVEQLYAAVKKHRLTLISAPAGSGKTTLTADMMRIAIDATVKWLSLDEGDNDPLNFGMAMLYAITSELKSEIVIMAQQGQIQSRQLGNLLVNHLADQSTAPFILVLDDLHQVTNQASIDFLGYIVDRLPEKAHIVATTRHDPPLALPKLRARGDLVEFRLDVLRFDRDEVEILLNQLLKLNISDALIDVMIERTEGWIAGLRLLALSLEKIDEDKREQYIADLAQNDRYVFDLLAEEVLAQQPNNIRQFLLKTSILDELTPELCVAVTEQVDAVNTLRELHRHNLFLVAVGDGSYRYHALFRDFLSEHLKREYPQHVLELHHIAATIHAQPLKKLFHFVQAQAWDETIDLVRQLILTSSNHVTSTRVEQYVNMVPRDLRDNNPWLILVKGAILGQRGYFEEANPILEIAQKKFQEQGDRQGELLTLNEFFRINVMDTDYRETVDYVFEEFSDLITLDQRIFMLTGRVWNSVFFGNVGHIENHIDTLVNLVIESDKLPAYKNVAQAIGAPLFFTSLGMRPWDRLSEHMKPHSEHDPIVRMGYNNIRAYCNLLHGKFDKALKNVAISRQIFDQMGGVAWVRSLIWQIYTSVWYIQENYAEIDTVYHEAVPRILQLDSDKINVIDIMYVYLRTLLWRNRQDEAREVVSQMREHIYYSHHKTLLVASEALIACHEKKFGHALGLSLQATEQQGQRVFSAIPLYAPLIPVQIHWQMNEKERASDELETALRQVAKWEMPLLVLQEGRNIVPILEMAKDTSIYPELCRFCLDILQANSEPQPISIPNSPETLTVREVEILREIVKGASNKEIADTLFISPNTVKSHITRILGKLNAKSRTEAIVLVRELNIIL